MALATTNGEGDIARQPQPKDIRAALGRVLDSAQFRSTKRLGKFLEYVVTESLAGRGDRLKGYTLGLEVFDRSEDFNPETDTIVRVQAGQMRRRLDLYYADEGCDDPVRISIPKGGYAAVFEDQSVSAQGTSAAADTPPPVAELSRGPSIAVLPFDNFSADPNDQFFADGLTEETIANLSRFKDLFVLSRFTSAKLARDGANIRRFHEETGVDFVLDGSVRKSTDKVRVTIQLLDAALDGHIHTEQIERQASTDGIFEIQDEIALLLAGRIANRHGPLGRYVARATRKGKPRWMETYYWITRFYQYYTSHDPELHLEVRDGLTAALKTDPDCSDAWAALSIILLDEDRFHINETPHSDARVNALAHAQQAVSCDPANAFAYHALAIAHYYSGHYAEFTAAAASALEFNSGNADILADIAHCYACQCNWERALPLIDKAIELSPAHPGWYHHVWFFHHLMNDNFESAATELKAGPLAGFPWHHAFLAGAYAMKGDQQLAEEERAKTLRANPKFAVYARKTLEKNCAAKLAEKAVFSLNKAGFDIE